MGFKRKIQALLAALICWPVAAQDYTPVPIAPQIIGTPQTMTPLNGGDDSTRLVQLAFPFQYFGQTYTQAWVSSNGFVSFNNVGHLCCNGVPVDQAPRNTIYGLWTDLISWGNPYYRTDATSTVFGWYNTQEYGSGLSNTLEISLFPDGKVQWNYGDVNNQWHMVTAGLTGPTMSDSISLFYGQNVNLLDNTSYVAGAAPPPAPDPAPLPTPIAGVPTPTPTASPVQIMTAEEEAQFSAAVDAVFEAAAAQADAMQTSDTATVEDVPQEVQAEVQTTTSDSEPAAEEAAAEESSSESSASTETSKASSDQPSGSPPPPPGFNPTGGTAASTGSTQEPEKVAASEVRRDRNVEFFQREAVEEADLFARETVMQATSQNVAFLAQADAQYVQQYGPQTTTDTVGVTYTLQPTEGPTFSAVLTTVIGDTAVSSPTGQAQQMELLNMGGMQGDMAAGSPTDVGDINTGDGEAMVQLAAVPEGYSAYTQARIPDLPFYQPKDIYKGRRIPDQNMALYLMMRGQDSRWQEMVDEQYE